MVRTRGGKSTDLKATTDQAKSDQAKSISALDVRPCSHCNDKIDSKSEALQCNLCDNWEHRQCGTVPPEIYKVLKENRCLQLLFMCSKCVKGSCAAAISTKRNVLSENSGPPKSSPSSVVTVVKECLKAISVDEARSRSLIFGNIPEVLEDMEYTPAEEKEDLLSAVEKITEHLRLDRAVVTECQRLGKKTDDNRPRLVKVVYHSAAARLDALRQKHRLKDNRFEYVGAVKFEYKSIWIRPDMSFDERKQYSDLRKKLLDRRDAGEEDLVIYRGEIVSSKSIGKGENATVSDGNNDSSAI